MRVHTRKHSEDIDLFTRTVNYVTNTVCNRHPKLSEFKESMVVPIAKEKVKETLDKMELGNILTAHDVELVTTSVLKSSLNNLVLKVHDI